MCRKFGCADESTQAGAAGALTVRSLMADSWDPRITLLIPLSKCVSFSKVILVFSILFRHYISPSHHVLPAAVEVLQQVTRRQVWTSVEKCNPILTYTV